MGVTPFESRHSRTVAKSPVVGAVGSVPIYFGDMVVELDFLVVEGSPLDVIIGDPTIKYLQGVIYIGKRVVQLTNIEHTVEFPLEPDYSRTKD